MYSFVSWIKILRDYSQYIWRLTFRISLTVGTWWLFCLYHLQAMTFHNLFTLNSDNKHDEIKTLLLDCMKDEQLEVSLSNDWVVTQNSQISWISLKKKKLMPLARGHWSLRGMFFLFSLSFFLFYARSHQ